MACELHGGTDKTDALPVAQYGTLQHLYDRIAALEVALDWYANEDRYLRRGMSGEFDPEIMCDGGRRARALLPDEGV